MTEYIIETEEQLPQPDEDDGSDAEAPEPDEPPDEDADQ